MTDSFDLSAADQRENIQEFLEAHGLEGLLTLYFRQLFYRYVKQELKSVSDEIDDVGTQLYFRPEGDELLTEHREELLEQCERRAEELVEDLKSDPQFAEVVEEDELEAFDELTGEFQERVHRRFTEWKEEGIELLENTESDAETDQQ